MEALTDGIFAIAMTLLVLELKVPDLPKSVSTNELLLKIRRGSAVLLQLSMISFLYCGLLWIMAPSGHAFRPALADCAGMAEPAFSDVGFSSCRFPAACWAIICVTGRHRRFILPTCLLQRACWPLQWLVAKRKKLINEDDPLASQLMGQQLMFFPVALGAGHGGCAFHQPAGGLHTPWRLCCWSLRLWQRKWHRSQATNP